MKTVGLWMAAVVMMGFAPSSMSADAPIPDRTPSPPTTPAQSREASLRLERLSHDYLEAFWTFNPIRAATAGLHAYDGRLPDRSRDAVAYWVVFNHNTLRRLQSVDINQLDADERVDFRVLQFQIGEELFQWEALAVHRTNPMTYDVGWGLLNVMRRNYASPEMRAKVAISLLERVPAYYDTAYKTLDDILPNALCEAGIQMLEGAAEFMRRDVPASFSGVKDVNTQSALRKSADRASLAVSGFIAKLRRGKLPYAVDSFAIGEKRFERLLRDTEGVALSVPALLTIAEKDLERNLSRARAITHEHYPGKTVSDIIDMTRRAAYANDRLIPEIADELESIRQFCIDREVITIPSPVRAVVTETPSFARWASAMMDTPGPFEMVATEAYYDVTPADPSWPLKQQADWLADFNKYVARNVSVHEAYPGHYVQFLHSNLAPTAVQKAFVSYAGAEGWAHYTEQMMIEAGIHDGDPLYEMAQLQDALMRNCRFVSAIRMHTMGMSVDEATQLFMFKGFVSEITARREAVRGTFDPGYFKYTLGKLQILKLRDDYRRKMGSRFTLKGFHDTFLARGMPPIVVIRERMLGPDNGPSL